jgi:hypothetical protein
MKIHGRLPCTTVRVSRFGFSANRMHSAGAIRKLGPQGFP